MNTIKAQVAAIKREKRVGLMTHVVVGYPSLRVSGEIVRAMAEAGADFVELQIPFSDPLADGPTIMKACEAALAKGVRTRDAINLMQKLSSSLSIPLLFMAYYNTIYKYGVERFCRDATASGAAGLIIPDLPIEEEHAEHFFHHAKKHGLPVIKVISRVSTDHRLALNAASAEGFVYCTARQGTTGVRSTIAPELDSFLKRVRKKFKIPIAVGFGISKRSQVQTISRYAKIVVVGSAIMKLIETNKPNRLNDAIKNFIRTLIPRGISPKRKRA